MDDETLGPGGTIAWQTAQGHDAIACVVAKRAYDHRFDEAQIEQERRCCRRASSLLGYREVRFLELRDELLDERLLDVVVPLEAVIADLRPDVVYTHHRGDSNQDHRAVFLASIVACRPHSSHPPRQLLCYEVPSSTDQAPPIPEFAFQPNYYVDVTDTLARKQEALAQYERELRQYPHPRSIEGLKVTAQKRGMESGLWAAEAFVSLREVVGRRAPAG
jgi:LmbE family N-acetylglucosaminyl deacetylase